MNPDRLICIVIPDFPLQVCVQSTSADPNRPAVVADENKASSRLVALNRAAHEQRVSLPMTVAQAGVYCDDLQVLVRNISLEDQESRRILNLLQEAGPCVESSGEGVFYFEASRLNRLYQGETGVVAKVRKVLESISYPIRIGVGSNKLIAGIAAHLCGEGGCHSVPSGQEREFLAPLSITHLRLPDETILKLHELGIRTIADLREFPPHEITLRFGDEVMALARFARGEGPSRFLPERLISIRMSRRIFDFPIVSRSQLLGYLKGMFEELLEPLRRRSEGGKGINVICYCQDGSAHTIAVRLDNPSSSPERFYRQALLGLEGAGITDGIVEVLVVLTEPIRLIAEQLDLESPKENSTAITERLAKELSDRGVHAVARRERRLPEERFSLKEVAPKKIEQEDDKSRNEKFTTYTSHPVAGMRLLAAPKASTVETESGRLRAVYIKGKRYPVLTQQGPWRLSGGWWSKGFERLYYDIETVKHQSLLVFFDSEENTWYLQGVFD